MYKANTWRNGAVPGPFQVNDECITCSVCGDIAPEHFRLGEDEVLQVVYRQPQAPDELARCREALDHCPVEAIEERQAG